MRFNDHTYKKSISYLHVEGKEKEQGKGGQAKNDKVGNISAPASFGALSIGSGLVAAVFLCMKRGRS